MSSAFAGAMLKAYNEGLGVDFALISEGVVKKVHSQVIMARSPYLEAKVNRWSEEKKELVIEDCDIATFNIIVDYMYGVEIPNFVVVNSAADEEEGSGSKVKTRKVDLLQDDQKLGKLLEMSERFLMSDLGSEVEALLVGNVDLDNFARFARLGERFKCNKLVEACAKIMMKGPLADAVVRGVANVMPKLSAGLVDLFGDEKLAWQRSGGNVGIAGVLATMEVMVQELIGAVMNMVMEVMVEVLPQERPKLYAALLVALGEEKFAISDAWRKCHFEMVENMAEVLVDQRQNCQVADVLGMLISTQRKWLGNLTKGPFDAVDKGMAEVMPKLSDALVAALSEET